MKDYLLKLSKLSLALMAFAAVSCTEDETSTDEPTPEPGEESVNITISNVVPTYNSVTFDVVAEDANAIAYIALEKGSSLTAQEVFDQGDAKGSTEGTFTYKGEGLNAETDYTLFVAAKSVEGNVGPATYDFTTAVNTGAASSEQAAGIRIVSMGTTSLSWEVTNGSDIDFSLTMVQPTILMENYCYEAAKSGISEEDYIKGFVTNTDYAYLVGYTSGAETTAIYNYDEMYSTYPMYPDGNYTIYTLGCQGDYDNYDYVALELTKMEITTEAIERIGNPYVDVTLKSTGYIGMTHTLTPNADTKYWTKFFTQTAELVEYVEYYDALEGEGAGRAHLKEFVQQYDPYVLEQSGSTDIFMDLDWGYDGIDFSRLALGFDANLMPGDDYDESIDQVLSVDDDSTPGEYNIAISDIGAGSLRMDTTLEPNCFRVYWKYITPGTYTNEMFASDAALSASIAQTLDAGGWVHFRKADDGQEDFTTNVNRDVQYVYNDFVWGEEPDIEYQILSVSLNYDGKFSIPLVSDTFAFNPRVMGDFEPAITVTTDSGDISKTNILVKYQVHDDYYVDDQRIFFHRFLTGDDEIFTTYPTDDSLREWMLLDNAYESNMWTLVSSDSTDEDPMSYYFNWAGMSTGTTYKYLYCTENGIGEVSNLKIATFITLNNDGGDNPEFTVAIDPESIILGEDGVEFAASGTVTPNTDVVEYKALFFEQSALESYYFDTTNEEELKYALYVMLEGEGMPYIEIANISITTFDASGKVWLAAQGTGANGIESMLSFVEFSADGTIGEQVDCDITPYKSAPYTTATNKTLNPESALFSSVERIKGNYQNKTMLMLSDGSPASTKAAASTRRITDQEAAELRAKGIPFYTMRDLTMQGLLKERLK
ncbi:MAG: hypothetical protein SNI51_02730 [Rikenellaceae bacterium]